ncbi:MAG: TIGR03084 family metal-binding protein [Pikeienuella sp.]
MQQARDFLTECERLAQLLAPLSEADFARKTQFKSWTINQIVQHLFYFDRLAALSVTNPDTFDADYAMLNALRDKGMDLPEATDVVLAGLRGVDLRAAWAKGTVELATIFEQTDPRARVKWVGPGMSARSSITARLMETWSHAQAIYDLLGQHRANTDALGNIVRLGVNTFGWTFANRGEDVPDRMPRLHLTAPSGAVWTYGDEASGDLIKGLAEEFCMVVTQTRNIADTSLSVSGPVATRWMAVAQCFAGHPRTPPAPGSRFAVSA